MLSRDLRQLKELHVEAAFYEKPFISSSASLNSPCIIDISTFSDDVDDASLINLFSSLWSRLSPAGTSLTGLFIQRQENKVISEASSTSSEKVEISIMQGEFSDADDDMNGLQNNSEKNLKGQ
jgi:hypothetical protein